MNLCWYLFKTTTWGIWCVVEHSLISKFKCCEETKITVIIEDRIVCVMSELEYNRIIET